jgi:hypothetical protein
MRENFWENLKFVRKVEEEESQEPSGGISPILANSHYFAYISNVNTELHGPPVKGTIQLD